MLSKWACSLVCLLGLATGSVSAQTTPVGGEFQVNSYTPNVQNFAAVALDANGDFVVAWQGYEGDTDANIFARRFNATGVPQAAEFQVNSYTPDVQGHPAVALDADGDFVVAWIGYGRDGDAGGIFARRFSAVGVPQAAEFQVNSYTSGVQSNPTVDADTDGDFVVAWQSNGQDGSTTGIFARRFSAAGVSQAAEFQVNTFTTSGQYQPVMALDDAGDFVVAWFSFDQDGASDGIFAQRFSAAGVRQAGEFQVNTYTVGQQGGSRAALALDADGDFVVAWHSYGQDGSYGSIFARRFSSAGVPQAVEFQVNSYTPGYQQQPTAALDADGDFVIAWHAPDQDGHDSGVFARRFSAAGVPQAAEFQVNSYTSDSQSDAALAAASNGGFVVAWHSYDQDGDDDGVFAQRFSVSKNFDIDGDGEIGALTDGPLFLRYAFGFRGATLVTGAVDLLNCTRCTAPEIESYIAANV